MHIFDFNENLYEEEVTIYFIKKLREGKKFDSADALIGQIIKDIRPARNILAASPKCIDLGL